MADNEPVGGGQLDSDSVPTAAYGVRGAGPGAQIGPYKLISILGEGGYGIVYLAEQQRPVKRRVALKVIKPGMDTKQVIARFEAERQALALLDHANIAHVFDAGTTEAGRPYFVMECVKGVPITEHCDRHKLSVEERLGLFLSICEAVQHAHQKSIIHRDLKPSNILVTIEGDRAIPMIIDFGVAKALSQSLTERTLVTEQAQMIGTPEYMSPEQAEMTSQDIDTRSDIYSLGVLLYELLTGVLPFEAQRLRAGGPEHIRHTIREEEPKTPSTRLSTISAEESARLAQLRRTDARALGRSLHGDLDWITLKAMEKDRTRRYGSAGELAADIRRHLNDEPVLAGPPSTLYRMRKCIRRHQALATGLAAVFLVLLAGITGIVVFALRAERQARTVQAVADFLDQDLLGAVAQQQAMSQQVTVRSILDAASKPVEGKLADRPLVEASVRQTMGKTYIELGDYKQAEPHLKRAYDLRRQRLGDKDLLTLDSISQLGRLYLLQGRFKEAEPLLVEALESRHRILGPCNPDTLRTSVWLGLVHAELAEWHETDSIRKAEELLTNALEEGRRRFGKEDPITLEAMFGLAYLNVARAGRADEAARMCFEGWETARNVLGEGHRLTFDFMIMGAWLEATEGRFEEGERHAQIGYERGKRVLGEKHPQTIKARGALGQIYLMQYRPDLAEPHMRESVRLMREVLGKGDSWLHHFMFILGRVYMMQGKYREAEEVLAELHELLIALSKERLVFSSSLIVRNVTAMMLSLYAMQERADELDAWCSQERERLARVGTGDGSLAAFILNGLAWRQATYPSAAIRDGTEAVENARQACELSDWSVAAYRDTLAAAYAEKGDFAAAVREQNEAIKLVARPGDVPASVRHLRYSLKWFESGRAVRAGLLTGRARAKIAEGQYDTAEQELTAALAAVRRYLGQTHPETRGCVLALIELYEAWDKPEEVEKWRAQLPPEDSPRTQ